jgi:hypothetical protein
VSHESGGTLFPSMEEHQRVRAERKRASYARRCLHALLGPWYTKEQLRVLQLRAEDDDDGFNFSWFNHEAGCPMALDCVRLPDAPIRPLIDGKGLTKTGYWRHYWKLRETWEDALTTMRPFGMIFPIPGMGDFVIHDNSRLPWAPRVNTIVRVGDSRENMLLILPAKAFILTLKECWTPEFVVTPRSG